MQKIIDVSEFNGAIDWTAVVDDCNGAIIRIGYRGWGAAGTLVSDRKAQYNLTSALGAGVPVGIYMVTQAITEAEAVQEAQWAVSQLHGRPCRLPICFDDEPAGGANGRGRRDLIDNATRTKTAIAFVKEVKLLGYQPAIYCSNSWFLSMLDGEAVRDAGALVWISSYPAYRGGRNVTPTVEWDGWQFSPYETVAGVDGDCDVSWFKHDSDKKEEWPTMEEFENLMAAYRKELQTNDAASWSKAARDWAVKSGIIQGGGDDAQGNPQYMWGDFVTREQMAVMLHRLYKLIGGK